MTLKFFQSFKKKLIQRTILFNNVKLQDSTCQCKNQRIKSPSNVERLEEYCVSTPKLVLNDQGGISDQTRPLLKPQSSLRASCLPAPLSLYLCQLSDCSFCNIISQFSLFSLSCLVTGERHLLWYHQRGQKPCAQYCFSQMDSLSNKSNIRSNSWGSRAQNYFAEVLCPAALGLSNWAMKKHYSV